MLLAKPLTFMNLSGQAVQALARFHKVEAADLLVVADDVNLPLGRLRARRGGSAGGHNGFKSVTEQLGTDQFPRLRVGVGGGEPGGISSSHVLGRFSADERQAILDAVNRAADAVEAFAAEGIEAVMNRFNADPERTARSCRRRTPASRRTVKSYSLPPAAPDGAGPAAVQRDHCGAAW